MDTDSNTSPISKLLETLGLTREDLMQRSDQMRRFLTADTSSPFEAASTTTTTAGATSSRSASNMARSMSRSRSTSFRDASPLNDPVKREPVEIAVPLRQIGSMEMVLERQHRQNRREKRQRKDKGKDDTARASDTLSPPLPALSHSLSLDTFMSSRDNRRVHVPAASVDSRLEARQTPPITPQKGNYYRDHSYPPNGSVDVQFSHPLPPLFPPPQALSTLDKGPSVDTPVTPHFRRSYSEHRVETRSPLPRSSSPASSSPLSSPNKPIVNLVSSPGPMGPAPLEEDYSELPYTLPPGPYSKTKPDQSYAALIGQAIISSPEHRLTLQEIYDWITIVYPYFKRGETTWMNSIRHVLSTTVVFRKVPRERTVGRSFWAIWDEDLPCFADKGFKKHLCKDMNGGRVGVENSRSRVRKRDADNEQERKAKKLKREKTVDSGPTGYLFPTVTQPTHPIFPPISHATPCHQPYFQTCITASFQQPAPSDVIFPPLPPTAAYRQVASSSSASQHLPVSTPETQPQPHAKALASQSSEATPPVPELTPNRSSSPVGSDLPTVRSKLGRLASSPPHAVGIDDIEAIGQIEDKSTDNTLFAEGSLRPVRDWGSGVASLEPSLILDYDGPTAGLRNKKPYSFPIAPSSPTPASSKPSASTLLSSTPARPSTPPPKPVSIPVTPPQTHRISPTHTPLSHKGLHMSPSASLAHYKSNLDPPPIVAFNRFGEVVLGTRGDENASDAKEPDILRTPPKKRSPQASGPFNPVTPRKLVFPSSGFMESPLRTPSNGVNLSPFRTPLSRGIFDPHDPSNLLDEELSRMGTQESPGGLFGKTRSSLLFESPNIGTSPSACPRWW
ncbi:hypothetical protein ONZ45_g1751 [Pleurotus djamor]|nr:hypothetical protein ONZ45_g1751 [Pleurotus djamor]